ncbi:MAG: glycosyltransferase family 2 protein [Candidatus Dormibacteria bacterium]
MTPRWGGGPVATVGLGARLACGAGCALAVGAALLVPLLPGRASGAGLPAALPAPLSTLSAVPSGSSPGPSPSPSPTSSPTPSVLCPTPALADQVNSAGTTTAYAVQAISQPGEPPATGLHSGTAGTWVQLNGSNLVGPPGCTTTITVGGQKQTYPIRADSANPAPPAGTASQLTFAARGASGPVQVTVTDPTNASNSSNSNYTFLGQVAVTAISTQSPPEGSVMTLSGSGFALGGLTAAGTVTYFQGAASPSPVICSAGTAYQVQSTPGSNVPSDTTLLMTAPTTYCRGDFAVSLSTQYNTQQPYTAGNANTVTAAFPPGQLFPIQVAAAIYYLNPSSPVAGQPLSVSGSGFGPGGRAFLSGAAVPVTSWTDHLIQLDVPSTATSGTLRLLRADGTLAGEASLTVLPVGTAVPPRTFGLVGPGGAPLVLFGGTSGPLSGSENGGGPSTVISGPPPLTPVVPAAPPVYPTTPVGFTAFLWISLALLAGAFAFGFINLGRIIVYGRRARRAGAAIRGAIAERVGGDGARRGGELRLGRHVRNVEVVGRSTPIGHLLLRRGLIDRHALRDSLRQQKVESRPLGEVLVARGSASEEDVWKTLGDQWGISLGDLDSHWIDMKVASRLTAVDSIKYRMLPIRAIGDSAIVAMADPFDLRARNHAERCLGHRVVPILAAPAAIRRRQETVYAANLLEDSASLLQTVQPEASAHELTTPEQRKVGIGIAVASFILAVSFGGHFFIGVAGAVVALYALVVSFRTYVIVRGSRYQDVFRVTQEEIDALTELPVYTILCPLYREAGVLPQLVDACAALDYPASLLDVKLLLEADDVETLDAVTHYPLPPYFDVVVVPADGPRTKPKACNYGLQFARGEYVVIFDAEDIPEPDQLKKALATFRRSEPDVGCVQAKLNFYNPRQNILTGWFALEYTSWFDFFLPGLVDLGMPVPLGGSSNHFPTSLLRELNAWDPNNVTEDADLGMRLHRSGYRTVIMESTTLEEANSDFVNWVKQRSRWGKGYAVSWLVQMRHPVDLLRAVGWKNFLAIQLTLGGTFGVAVLNLAVWFLTLLWAAAQFNFIAYLFPTYIYYVGMIELIFGNFFFLYMGVWSCQYRKSWELTRVALLAPLYWLMMSLAMLKAALQLVTKPTYWEKTVHGLYEHAPDGAPPEGPVAAPEAIPAHQPADADADRVAVGGGVSQK